MENGVKSTMAIIIVAVIIATYTLSGFIIYSTVRDMAAIQEQVIVLSAEIDKTKKLYSEIKVKHDLLQEQFSALLSDLTGDGK